MIDAEKSSGENNREKVAMVCYCTLRSGKSRNTLGRLMYRVQERFENAGFREVQQAFAAGSKFPFLIPFQKYPMGFRARPDEEEGVCFLENLILSYGLFLHYHNAREGNTYEKFYLILLREGSYEYEEELKAVLERYYRLKEAMGITVCCFTEEREEPWEIEFADTCKDAAFLITI